MVRTIKSNRGRSKERRRQIPLPASSSTGLTAWWRRWRQSTRRAEARSHPPTTTAPTPSKRKKGKPDKALCVDVKPLYLVQGQDGRWRGAPDPTMVICAWAIDGNVLRTVLRSVVRFAVHGKLPGAAQPDVTQLISTSLGAAGRVLVAVALYEENRGDDVRRLTVALEHPATLHFVDFGGDDGHGHSSGNHDAIPKVMSALECANDPRLLALVPRGIVLADGDAATTTTDQWVGGAVVVVSSNRPRSHRLSLHSIDGRQDWTVEFATT
jgi:hypothetical protein